MATTFRLTAGRIAAGLAVLLLAAGCGTTSLGKRDRAVGGTSVTRFHLGSEIARGEIAVEQRYAVPVAGGVWQPAFADTVARELSTLGFKPAARGAPSEFVATVDVATATRLALQARAPGSPVAAAVRPNAVATQLAVQIKRRSDGSIVWEGRAQDPARAGSVATPATIEKLARALFKDFPGESGRTISVR